MPIINEVRLKYYNSELKIGFNNLREAVFNLETKQWLQAKEHKGRLVYGNQRIPYNRIKEGLDSFDYVAQEYCPF